MHFEEFDKNEIKIEIDSKSFLHELEEMELEIEEELNLLEEFEQVQEEFEVLGLITEKKFESIEKEICWEKKEIEEMMIIISGNVFTLNLNQTV